jgi:nucleotide-binding universal stress UspA family protein
MDDIVMGVDRNEERVKAQVQSIKELPLNRDSVTVTILHIFSENPEGASASQIGTVRHAAEELEDSGFTVEMKATAGSPASVITRVAEDKDACLISVAGRKRSPSGKALFGSTSQSVLLGTDVPVMVSGTSKKA